MMKPIFNLNSTKFKLVIFLFLFFVSLLFSIVVKAEDYGLGATADAAGLKNTSSLPTLIGNVIGTGLAMIGVVFFVLMVYAGVLWMTARGNETTSKKAFDTIVAAAIGMIIVLASYALTNFVFTSVATGSPSGGGGSSELLSNGAACNGNDDLCQSGFCGDADVCVAPLLSNGSACNGNDYLCASGFCDGDNGEICATP